MGVFFHFRRLCSLILHVHENAPTLYGALSALFDAGRCGRTKVRFIFSVVNYCQGQPSFSGFCPPPLPPPHPSDSTGAQRCAIFSYLSLLLTKYYLGHHNPQKRARMLVFEGIFPSPSPPPIKWPPASTGILEMSANVPFALVSRVPGSLHQLSSHLSSW